MEYLLLAFVGLFILWLITLPSVEPDEQVTRINKHGHRCYARGLTDFEYRVVEELAFTLNSNEYFIFNNLILPSEKNTSTQIDHVVVSPYGVFVLESKDLGGWIYRKQFDTVWTQKLHKRHTQTFQNPMHQNYGHVEALAELLHCKKSAIRGCVVLSERSEFKTARPQNVIYLSELASYIQSYKTVLLSHAEVTSVLGVLLYMCQASNISHDQHVRNVNALKLRKQERLSTELLS